MTFSRPLPILKRGILVLFIAFIIGYCVHDAAGSSGGIVGRSKEGCGGDGCHGTQSTATVVHIYSSASEIMAGQTYVFTISVSNPTELGAGCDISTDLKAGKFALNGNNSGLQYYSPTNELTHTEPQQFTGDSAVWSFKYTAPTTTGTTHIYAAGNAVNLDGSADAQDHWNLTVDTLQVVASDVAPVADESSAIVISPNPSQGRMTLFTAAISGPSIIDISDASGRKVFSQSIVLQSATPFDCSTLSSGNYFMTVQPRNGSEITRSFAIQK